MNLDQEITQEIRSYDMMFIIKGTYMGIGKIPMTIPMMTIIGFLV